MELTQKNQNFLSSLYHRINKIEQFFSRSSARFFLPFAVYTHTRAHAHTHIHSESIHEKRKISCLQTIELPRRISRRVLRISTLWKVKRGTLMQALDRSRRAITYYRRESWVIASEYRQEIGQKLQAAALLTLAVQSSAGQIFIVLLSWLMHSWLPTGQWYLI